MLAAMINAYVIVRTIKLDLYEKPRLNRALERCDDNNTRRESVGDLRSTLWTTCGARTQFRIAWRASPRLHAEFLQAISRAEEDPSNKLLDVETQLAWLRECLRGCGLPLEVA